MMQIDWNAPLEAAHTDGRVVPVKDIGVEQDGIRTDSGMYDGWCGVWQIDGSPQHDSTDQILKGWRIRNAQSAAAGYSPEMQERMVALIGVAAGLPTFSSDPDARHVAQEAAAIWEIVKPVDPDLIEANRITDADSFRLDGLSEEHANRMREAVQRIALAALKRGRELEEAPNLGWAFKRNGER